MKKISLFLFAALLGCAQIKKETQHFKKVRDRDLYTVYKIDSINSFYLIYAKQGAALFKIVSKKVGENLLFPKISVNKKYNFVLHSQSFNPVTGKTDILPENSLLVGCYYYDDSTVICLEWLSYLLHLH